MEYNTKYDFWLIETRLPMSVHGFVCRRNGQTYMVINADLSEETKRETVDHEMDHIEHGDLYREDPATQIEDELCMQSKNRTGNGWYNSGSTEKRKR